MMPAATFPTPFRLALLPLLLTLAACSGSGEAASAGEHAATASTGDSTPAIASAAAPAAATVASTPAATAGTTEAAATPAAEASRATAAAAAPAARVSETHEPAAAEAAADIGIDQRVVIGLVVQPHQPGQLVRFRTQSQVPQRGAGVGRPDVAGVEQRVGRIGNRTAMVAIAGRALVIGIAQATRQTDRISQIIDQLSICCCAAVLNGAINRCYRRAKREQAAAVGAVRSIFDKVKTANNIL